jgi:DNA-binding IclR family transcriptional regulator
MAVSKGIETAMQNPLVIVNTEHYLIYRMTKSIASAIRPDSKAPAIARAAAVLRLLGKSEVPLGVNAIARELGLVPSTCLYVLRALADEELVAFDPDIKRYALDAGVLTLARGWLRRDRFVDVAQPVLDRLARAHGLTIMGVRIGGLDHITVVAVAEGGANFRLSAQVGSRFPALISATGRCIAAFGGYPEPQIKARFHTLRWENSPSYPEWQAQVADTRARGFAIDDGNYIAGVTVLAAPVWKANGKPGHALVAIGLGNAMKRDGIADALRAGAQTMSSQLGG